MTEPMDPDVNSSARTGVVWDGAVRGFHWLLVLGIAGLWWTGENGLMDWHRRLGLGLLGLMVFRIYWGFAGPQTARFGSFVKGPAAIVRYGRALVASLTSKNPGQHKVSWGHNPIGALSVVAMVLAVSVQVSTGLFAVDVDGLESGPLARHVDFETGRVFAEFHEIAFNVLVALIVLHVMAIAVYQLLLKQNLIAPMITGRKSIVSDIPQQNPFPFVRLLIGLALSAASVWATTI